MIPIDPDWLIEALGTLEIDPSLPHQGPYTIDKQPDCQSSTVLRNARGTEHEGHGHRRRQPHG